LAKKYQLKNDKGATIKYRLDETLTVRGSEVTYEKLLDLASMETTDSRYGISPIQKWSSSHGQVRDYTKGRSETDQVMRLAPLSVKGDTGNIHRRHVELALGFGLGRSLQSIESISDVGGAISIKGKVVLSENQTGTCIARLDSDYVVRQAQLEVVVGLNTYLYQVETEGTYQAEGFCCAKKGHLLLSKTTPKPEPKAGAAKPKAGAAKSKTAKSGTGKSKSKAAQPETRAGQVLTRGAGSKTEAIRDRVVEDIQVECKSIRFGLGDEEYEELTQMPAELGMQIMDHYRLLTDDERRAVGLIPPIRPTGLYGLLGVGPVALFCIFLLAWRAVGSRRTARE
jgi:hypothetical protein